MLGSARLEALDRAIGSPIGAYQLGVPSRFDSFDLWAARSTHPARATMTPITPDRSLKTMSFTLVRNEGTNCSMIVGPATGSLRRPMGVARNVPDDQRSTGERRLVDTPLGSTRLGPTKRRACSQSGYAVGGTVR